MCIREQRGSVSLVWLLLILPLLLLVWTAQTTVTQVVSAGDVDLQRGLEAAVRAAAMRVTADSQAAGDPRVHADQAHATFRGVLAANLGLDPTTLVPLPGSAFSSRPDYGFAVYNVDGTWAAGGAPAGRKYRFSGGTLTVADFGPSGGCWRFGIVVGDVLPGSSGTFDCTLDRPGTVASVSVGLNRAMGRDPVVLNRWLAAKVVKVN